MLIPTRLQTMTALLLLMAGVSALEATGALTTFVSADSTMTIQLVRTAVSTEPPSASGAVQSSDSTQTAGQTESTATPNNTSQLVLQIQPSSDTISAGALAKFDIHILGNSTADVFLVARNAPPDSIAIFTPNVGVANFNSSLTIVTSADTPPSNYTITAVAIVNGNEFTGELSLQILASASATTSANTTMNVSFATTLAMTLSTDQAQYEPNSTVNIQGQVTDATGSAVADATVSIQVDAPTGAELFYTNNIHSDSAGIFQARVGLTSTSPTGTYTVFTSATKPGYSSSTTRTTFVVGTSTTPSVIIKAVYVGDSAGNPTSTFTAGQTVWVWVVIENIGTTFQGVLWIQVRDPNGVPVQIQTHIAKLEAGETIKDSLAFTLVGHPTIGVYTVNALVSDKLISEGGTFLASSETEFALIG